MRRSLFACSAQKREKIHEVFVYFAEECVETVK